MDDRKYDLVQLFVEKELRRDKCKNLDQLLFILFFFRFSPCSFLSLTQKLGLC